jgi:hypothetical protein
MTGSPSDSKNINKKTNLNPETNDDDTNSKKGGSDNQDEDMSEENGDDFSNPEESNLND